ncbi:MAG TPA: YfiR family protein [Pseudomonadales bacterium]|nr:YfiR family protein [Pseudomonadales bacterium]
MVSAASQLSLSADEVPEYQLKAAFLYNFAKFIDWPAGRSLDSLNICAISSEVVARTLRDIAKQNVGERRVNILLIGDKGSPAECHLLFVERQYPNYLAQHASQLNGVVTVGETDDFTSKGGVISFYKENDKLRFEVHLGNAKQTGVTMNARLLRLAKVVGG